MPQPLHFSSFILIIFLIILLHLYLKNIYYFAVGAAKTYVALLVGRQTAAVTQDVDKGESDVHRHRAKPASFRVKIEAVADLMAAVAAAFALAVDQRDRDLRFHQFHLLAGCKFFIAFMGRL